MAHSDVSNIATPQLNAIKDAFFAREDPDAPPIVLHRSDFLKAKGALSTTL